MRGLLFALSIALLCGGAFALPPNASAPLVGGRKAVTVNFGNHIASASGTGTFGADATGRVIVVGIVYSLATLGNVNSVTIGGGAGTQRQRGRVDPGSGNYVGSEIWTATVPTGASGTVTATPSTSFNRVSMAVASIYGASSEAGTSGTNATALNNTVGASLTIPIGGVGVGDFQCTDSISASSVSLVNLTSVLNNQWVTSAVHAFGTAAAGTATRTGNCNGGAGSATMAMTVNAWGP